MICTVVSPKETRNYKSVQSIMLPAVSGTMQILSGHAESFILLKEGSVVLQQPQKQEEIIPVPDGECHIKDDTVTIIL